MDFDDHFPMEHSAPEDYHFVAHDRQVAQLRVPPHSLEAESSVLGGLLLDNSAWDRVADLLHDGDFYRYEHRLIFAAIDKLTNTGKPADVITVYEHLEGQGKGGDVGGLTYLNQLGAICAKCGEYSTVCRDCAGARCAAETGRRQR